MVYKRFVKRNGKIFGPYYYESYRQGDSVKKKYIGDEKEYQEWLKKQEKRTFNFNQIFLFIFISLIIVISIFSIVYFKDDKTDYSLINNFISFKSLNNFLLNNPKSLLTGAVVSVKDLGNNVFKESNSGIEGSLDNSEYGFDKIQYKAVINQSVKWVKEIDSKDKEIEIPLQTRNIVLKENLESNEFIKESKDYEDSIKDMDRQIISENKLSGNVGNDILLDKNVLEKNILKFKKYLKNLFSKEMVFSENELDISEGEGNRVLNLENLDLDKKAFLEYYTEAPSSSELEINKGKLIKISGPDELGYEDILAYTLISEDFKLKNKNQLELVWINNNLSVDFEVYDTNKNGFIDYIEWNVPHLSEQIYQVIIKIKKAEHFDVKGVLIKDITEEVYEKDDIWADLIKNNEYIEVSFLEPLKNFNDITLYAKSADLKNVSVEVFVNEGSEKIAEFKDISEERYYKVYLNNLEPNKTYNNFKLKIISLGKGLELDQIIDPPIDGGISVTVDISPSSPEIHENLTANVSITGLTNNESFVVAYTWYKNTVINRTTLIFDDYLTLYLPFNNNTFDFINLSNGTMGGAPVHRTSSKVYGGYYFDGTDDSIHVGKPSVLQFSGGQAFTICAWANATSKTNDYGRIFSADSGGSSSYGYRLFYDQGNGNWSFEYDNGGSITPIVGTSVELNTWIFICGLYDGSNQKLYEDGIEVASQSIGSLTVNYATVGNFAVGRRLNSPSNEFQGELDEIMIWNRTLSSSEIQKLYQGGYNVPNFIDSRDTDYSENWTVGVRVGANEGWTSSQSLSSIIITSIASNITNCTTGCFYIKNKSNDYVAIIDKTGNMDLVGQIIQDSIGSPDGDDLLFRTSAGVIVSWIDGNTGNLRLSNNLTENTGSYCSPPSGSFVFRDDSDNCVTYISDSGAMVARGDINPGAEI